MQVSVTRYCLADFLLYGQRQFYEPNNHIGKFREGRMKLENSGKIKFGVWGLIVGAVVVMIIGFAWGGWLTQSSAEKMSGEAVLASQAAICVAQFVKQPNYEQQLKDLKELDSWKRAEFIEKGGWDKMPGQQKAGSYVAQACAKGIEVLVVK
ncbi:MAG: hypothetical protein COW41_04095 [Deltaproteobacteria bacterium CG17_big_fil_post_rev_8_21_14_2_50_51_6]|nr:MAG: hypothetical protein COW41_04095 [Deltaproteobacteria bacterium CG17_big_fil_post_rev_8_21_14_2_50_51_6]